MQWHVNDLSVNGQFGNVQELREALEPLLGIRLRNDYLRDNLYSSRRLSYCQATSTTTLCQAITATGDKNFIRLALGWLGKSGPFWEDDRQFYDYDYFEFDGKEVTEQGLGEAARRLLSGRESRVFSFRGIPSFEQTPLGVQHGFADDGLDRIIIENDWLLEQLEVALQKVRRLRSWIDVQLEIAHRFDAIRLAVSVMEKLTSIPFSRAVANRVFEILKILNRLVEETGAGGELSGHGKEIMRNYFSSATAGKTPLFKDESPRNKREFRTELTFVDPADSARSLFCPWHAKIQTPQIRIHFEWPRPIGQREIKVVYIGPKITKK